MRFLNRKTFALLLGLLGTLHFGAPLAFAEASYGGAGPSSGTVFAAAMETAGYVAQAQFFAQLKTMIEQLGGLVYLCCVLSAVLVVSLSGRYPTGLWLLVGPPMFFFLIRAESTAKGVEWQFGTYNGRASLDQILRGANVNQNAASGKVSNFFHSYNVIISSLYQELIKVLTSRTTEDQMLFMARQKVIDDMFSQRIDNPKLYQLVRFTWLICDQEMNAARMVALGQRDRAFRQTGEYRRAVITYCELFPLVEKDFPHGDAKDWVKELLRIDENDAKSIERLATVSCQALWSWMEIGLLQMSANHLEESLKRHLPVDAGADIRQKTLDGIKAKLSKPTPFRENNGKPFICTNGTQPGGNVDTNRLSGVPLIMATWMLRGTMLEGPLQSQQVQAVLPNSNIQPATLSNRTYTSSNRAQGQEVVRRFKSEQLAESAKYEAFILAKLLPYMQGAGLYILAVIYPFFCLLVLLPGHAGGFLVWLALWAWLKSWDVGWALVYIADKILWDLMPHRTYFRMAPNGASSVGSPSADPVTILEAAFAGDYSYSLATYWVMLAGMLGAVPVISAHAVLGSKRAIAGIFVDGVKTIGQPFSKAAGDWVAMEQLGEVDRRTQQSALFSRTASMVQAEHARITAMQQGMSAQNYRARAEAQSNLIASQNFAAVRQAFNRGGAALGQPELFNQAFQGFRTAWNGLASQLPDRTLPRIEHDTAALERQIADANTRLQTQRGIPVNDANQGTGFAELMNRRWEAFRNAPLVHGPFAEGLQMSPGMRALASDFRIIEDYMNSGRTQQDQRSLAQRLDDATQNVANTQYATFRNNAQISGAALRAFHIDAREAGAPTPGTNRLLAGAREQYMNAQMLAVLGENILQIRDSAAIGFFGAGLTRVIAGQSISSGQLGRLQGVFRGLDVGAAAVGNVTSFEMAEMQRLYFATQALSIEMERGANAASAQYLQLASRHFFYQTARSEEFASYERIRAGISGRAEWWSCADAPYSLEMDADREAANLQALGQGWLGRMQAQGGVTAFRQAIYFGTGGFVPAR